ncbi:MAG: transglutaminase family protein [Deltaproteobacteria bacterium]|nr:transglutaminase family protein [Deltaproteobacteria bacterium]MBW2078002.1 transglutaminase family protein [Deltaproteobacteria bacterium]
MTEVLPSCYEGVTHGIKPYHLPKGREKMSSNMERYLRATPTIDADHETIIETATRLTRRCSSDQQKAVKLFYFVRDKIKYNIYMVSVFIEDFRASRVLAWGKGYCVQKAVLLAALGRASGIPSRLVFAKIRNHKLPAHILEMMGTNTFPRHGYNQFFLNGRWVSAAATFNKELCEKNGLPTVEFDGRSDAVLPDRDFRGEPFIEYLEKFAPRDDLPFAWIAQSVSKIVGPDKRPWFKGDQDEETAGKEGTS